MPHPVDILVGKRVRLRRLQLSLSQTELAQKLGLTFQQVQKYEKGANRISCSRIYEISEVLDTSIAFFFSDALDTDPIVSLAQHLAPNQLRNGLRLMTAFRRIVNVDTRNKLLALVESMVPDANSRGA